MSNEKDAKPTVQGFHIPVNPMRVELDGIKKRQLERKATAPREITLAMLYQMGSDILENQARIENTLKQLLGQRK